MIRRIILYANLAVIFILLLSCSDHHKPKVMTRESMKRTFMFSGFEWEAEGSGTGRISPGQNYFSCSEENVRVDKRGNLHLKITNRNGNWYCAKVTMKKSYGYNKYLFQVATRVDRLDKNVVGGLFTYLDDSNEIDIEFARWGIDGNTNAQFAVQPAHYDGNIYRYTLDLKSKKSTHVIDWKEDTIGFAGYRGYRSARPDPGKIICEWSYTGKDIPAEAEEVVMINLWLYNGLPPSDGREAEMVIRAVKIL